MQRLIVTADDYGLSLPVNEAVERGHREGILTCASLMVSAPASDDAVERARSMPHLRVGLHLVLVNGRPACDPQRIPLLVDRNGEFERDLLSAGVRYFFTPGIRSQLETEIRAQFQRFAQTGLPLDHVNAQNHFHLHPTVCGILVRVGREFGLRAVRVPYEPFGPSWRAMRTRPFLRFANAALLAPWLSLMRRRLNAAGIATNDFVFGLNDSGHVTPETALSLLAQLPRGVTELYVHPATHAWPGAEPPDYDFSGEFATLIDPRVVKAARAYGPESYGDISHAA